MDIYEVKARIWFHATAEDGDDRPVDDVCTKNVGVRHGGIYCAIEKFDAAMHVDVDLDAWEILSVSLLAEADL